MAAGEESEEVIEFTVHFRRRKQWFLVQIMDESPDVFERKGGGRWGCWDAASGRNINAGLFGTLQLVASRVCLDGVQHELDHVRSDWLIEHGIELNRRTEEGWAEFVDELTRNFWRAYLKVAKLPPPSRLCGRHVGKWISPSGQRGA